MGAKAKVTRGKGRGQGWLAGQCKVSQPRISQLVSEGRIPRRASYSPEDVARAKAMLLDGRAGNNATAADLEASGDETAIQALSKNPERVARIKLIIERTAKLKLERELLAGGYIKKEDADKEKVGRVYSVRAKLQEIPLRASLVAHKSEAECERILTDWMREVCDYYANGGN